MDDDRQRRKRLATLDQYGMIDSPREEQFDEIVRAAAFITGAPIAMVTIVDDQRQWFKAKVGVDHDENGLDESFCFHAIRHDDLLVVNDAATDERFRHFTNVTGTPHIRFYAGIPLRMENGVPVGTLCVIDTIAREGLDEEERAALTVLARRTVAAFEIRRDIQAAGGSILPSAGDRPWLEEASTLLVKAAAALEQVDAQVPLAHLEQVIALVDDMRQAAAERARTT